MTNAPPNVEKRSTNGCWTCRLRKLKCDEARDTCGRCRRHGIPCAGYGPERPEWKDGGVKEAERLMVIKALVSKRRKRNHESNHTTANLDTILPVSPPAEPEQTVNLGLSSSSLTDAATDVKGSLDRLQLILEHGPHPSKSALLSEELRTGQGGSGSMSTSKREAELVGHYFDHIFSLQFQHYAARFSPKSWLLPLIQTIIPLRYAILSISALHQYRSKGLDTTDEMKDEDFHELQEHYGTALRMLRQFIDESSTKSSGSSHVPIICCCVQLISFDVSGSSLGLRDSLC